MWKTRKGVTCAMGEADFMGIERLLPLSLRRMLEEYVGAPGTQPEEVRLREGQAPSLVCGGEELVPPAWCAHRVSAEEIAWVLEAAGKGSVHTVMEQLKQGFLSVEGGHRIGLCGSVAMKGAEVYNFRRISSLSLRICREIPGVGERVLPDLLEEGRLQSTLIFSPPGAGKTTLLRDLVRCISDGVGMPAQRIGVADERGEICGLYQGRPQRAVGRQTDVMDGGPKALALLMLLRGMNPQVLAADEITAPADVQAIEEVAGCGVTLLATAHGAHPEEVGLRPVYRTLLTRDIFRRFIWIETRQGRRRYEVLRREEMKERCCISWATA